MSTKPRELDIDLNRMRAEKIAELRLVMRDLDDLDAMERVLNGHTHHIAMTASVTIAANGGNGNGQHKHEREHELLQAAGGEEDVQPSRRRYKKREGRSNTMVVMDQIVSVLALKGVPLQNREIAEAIAQKYPPPYCADSTFSRALRLLRDTKRISAKVPLGSAYPTYSLVDKQPVRKAKAQSRPSPKSSPKRTKRRSPSVPRQYKSNPNGMAAGVLRVLADHPDGLEIPQISALLEQEGTTKFIEGYTHNTQVSWAIKGHREKGRINSIELGEGRRLHKAVRPTISVSKEE